MSEQQIKKPIVGITLGDYNGIGPEVILKALKNNQLTKICTPVIYGSMRILNRYRQQLDMKDWNLFGIQKVEQANPKATNVITCWLDPEEEIQPGQVTNEAGKGAFESLKRATEDLKEGKIDALVTAPINKNNILSGSDEVKFVGHTDYLAKAFNAKPLMFMVSERLRVGLVTDHISIKELSQQLTKNNIVGKVDAMIQSLKNDFGIKKPRIAVLGLNPHAGEEGLLGKEEIEVIAPAIKQFRDKGQLVFGPYPADGFFAAQSYKKFDAVLAMYHDQGLIPFKTIAFDEGVNYTAGLSVVRTSPDHGTAYDIAGKNKADESSMLQAIYMALDIVKFRTENAEMEKNALKKNPAVEKMTNSSEKY